LHIKQKSIACNPLDGTIDTQKSYRAKTSTFSKRNSVAKSSRSNAKSQSKGCLQPASNSKVLDFYAAV